MMRSLWSGVSGLQAHQIAMDVEGNNIANVNTYGFKYNRANFADILSQTPRVATAPQGQLGGQNAMQIGLGTTINSTTRIFSQGTLTATDKQTDLALQGNGFFVVSPDGGNTRYYTRNGDFVRDKAGNFVNNSGYIVQGWTRDEETGTIDSTGPISNIVIKEGLTTPARATTEVKIKGNLDSGSSIGQRSTPIYALDSIAGGRDFNNDGILNANEVHNENDVNNDEFYTNSKKEQMLTERGVDLGVTFDELGNGLALREGQGIWISYANAKTQKYTIGSDTPQNIGQFVGQQKLNITLNGVKIENKNITNISDVAAAINAQYNKTGVRAEISEGNKLTLINRNNSGTTEDTKNIHLTVYGDDTTGLGSIDVITAYQYTYTSSQTTTVHPNNDKIARQVTTTEDLRRAMQEDARYHVDYNGDGTILNVTSMDELIEQIQQTNNANNEAITKANAAAAAATAASTAANTEAANALTALNAAIAAAAGGGGGGGAIPGVPTGLQALLAAANNAATAANNAINNANNQIGTPATLPAANTAATTAVNNANAANSAVIAAIITAANAAIAAPGAGVNTDIEDLRKKYKEAANKAAELAEAADNAVNAANVTAINAASMARINADKLNKARAAGTATAQQEKIKSLSDLNDGVKFTVNKLGQFQLENPTNDKFDQGLYISTTALTKSAENTTTPAVNENVRFTNIMKALDGALSPGQALRASGKMMMSSHGSTAEIFDSLGSKHTVSIKWAKTGTTKDGGTEWNMIIQVPEPAKINYTGEGPDNVVTGSVRFNSNGSLASFHPATITFSANNGSQSGQNVSLNFGLGTDFNGLTSFDKDSSTESISQDGYTGGTLNGVKVDETGTIIGSFTNGQSFGLAQVALASFTNNEGLQSEGGNVFSQTANSGEAVIGAAGTGDKGTIAASKLEASNVDLSRALTDLIVIQRGFQANSKTITTSDEMLNTLLQLKQ
ncbi:Flagellar hook subunit protein [Campylobacter concisus UNSW3]|uniref:Flagellar hook protein FlgE n=1 Tax=Campylobacter concisus UNSW3 TaxID=1242966 RepID=U2GBU5_9BACT|nr:flagellar hook protein FlgE [Campylobacter concisus]ERJ23483.1 Flagellar hook subunit protein [Campylobacter concisus UNSW3]